MTQAKKSSLNPVFLSLPHQIIKILLAHLSNYIQNRPFATASAGFRQAPASMPSWVPAAAPWQVPLALPSPYHTVYSQHRAKETVGKSKSDHLLLCSKLCSGCPFIQRKQLPTTQWPGLPPFVDVLLLAYPAPILSLLAVPARRLTHSHLRVFALAVSCPDCCHSKCPWYARGHSCSRSVVSDSL